MHERLQKALLDHVEISEVQISTVLACFKAINCRKGEILLAKGEIPRHLYFVEKGGLRVFCISQDGRESTRFLAFEGAFATSFPGFIRQAPSLAFLESLEASTLSAIHYLDFQRLLQTVPPFERMHRIFLENNYAQSISRIEQLITLNARDRYLKVLEETPFLLQRLSNYMLASYLGISQETLSRLKKEI